MSITKNEILGKLLSSMDAANEKLATQQTFGQKALAGLSIAAKATGMKVATVGGNVIDTTYKLGKVAAKASFNATEVLNAVADRADKQLDELALEGQALGLNRFGEIAASTSNAYNSVKDKFSKKEQGSASVGGNAPINVEAKVV